MDITVGRHRSVAARTLYYTFIYPFLYRHKCDVRILATSSVHNTPDTSDHKLQGDPVNSIKFCGKVGV